VKTHPWCGVTASLRNNGATTAGGKIQMILCEIAYGERFWPREGCMLYHAILIENFYVFSDSRSSSRFGRLRHIFYLCLVDGTASRRIVLFVKQVESDLFSVGTGT
jgi:hypothetical protein